MATIIVTNNRLNFDASHRKLLLTYTIELDTDETFTSIKVVSNRQWCNVKNTTISVYQTEIELASNNSTIFRDAEVTITLVTSKNTYTNTVTISQKGFEIHPIWANNIVKIETQLNYIQYEVRHNSKTIYSGKAYTIPNTNYVEIDMSRICSPFLNSSIENKLDEPVDFAPIEGVKSFNLYVNGEIEGSFLFFNSYTYKDNPPYLLLTDGDTMLILSDPIRKQYDSRQLIIYSFFNVLRSGGYGCNVVFDFDGYIQRVYGSLAGRQEYVTLMKAPDGANSVNFFGEKFPIKKTCCKYCLYYQNALGGWDSFLINGNDKQTDKITSYNYRKAINNTTKQFATKKYLNVINTSYKLYTDWLTDDEASRMHHLLESTEVYLHNLEDDTIIPVSLTNSTCEYKTFTNNARRKFYYEINAELAQQKIRQ